MKKQQQKKLIAIIIAILLLTVIWLGYKNVTNSCCQEVNRLQVDLNKLNTLDRTVHNLLLDLNQANDSIEKLKIKLAEAQNNGNLDEAAEILQVFDNLITEMKGIDDEMQAELRNIGPITGVESMRNACEIIKNVVESNRQELEITYNEIARYNRELRDANQKIADLQLQNATLSSSLENALSEKEKYRKDNEDLWIQVANLKGQLAVANNDLALAKDKIQDLENAVTNATSLINAVKSSIPIAFEINMKKFVAKEGKSFKIPVIIKENVALLKTHEKRNCIVHLRVGRIEAKGANNKIHYLETNNIVEYNGQKKSYNGVYSFEWGGEELQFDIDVVTTEKKKIKLTQSNFIYDYYIFMDGKENMFKEDCLPNIGTK